MQLHHSNPETATQCNFRFRMQRRMLCRIAVPRHNVHGATDTVIQPRRIAIILHYRIPPHVRLYSIYGSAIWLAKHSVNLLRPGVTSERCIPISVDTLIQSGSHVQIVHLFSRKEKTHHTTHKLYNPDRKDANHRSRHNTVRALALNPLKAIPHLNASAK